MRFEECMCWNYMTPKQQADLADTGIIYQYGGGACTNKAEVRVRIGTNPGDRYYCQSCALNIPHVVLSEGRAMGTHATQSVDSVPLGMNAHGGCDFQHAPFQPGLHAVVRLFFPSRLQYIKTLFGAHIEVAGIHTENFIKHLRRVPEENRSVVCL